ncbi:MAG TPA: two-component regulator propeller domain-containing protein, partial [Candidatus Paceibacterota bacterium]|nr:two-component regulator propeller domain-containing protein [Candidatus Paceibacterota bacterium]
MRSKKGARWAGSELLIMILYAVLMLSCSFGGNWELTPETSPKYTIFYSPSVMAVVVDGSGDKWFGTSGGAWYLDDKGTPSNTADDTAILFGGEGTPLEGDVNAVALDASGGMWFCTYSGVVYLDDHGTPDYKNDDTWATFSSESYRDVAIDPSGAKWFLTPINPYGDGVRCLDDNGTPTDPSDDAWCTFRNTDGLAGNSVRDTAIDASGGKWFASRGGGLSHLDDQGTPTNKADDTWTLFTTSDGLFSANVAATASDSSDGIWVVLGVACYLDHAGTPSNKTDDVWTIHPFGSGLLTNNVSTVRIDSSGGVWIGTNNGGACYLDDHGTSRDKADDSWATFTTLDGLVGNRVYAIAVRAAGGAWFGTPDGASFLDDHGTPA